MLILFFLKSAAGSRIASVGINQLHECKHFYLSGFARSEKTTSTQCKQNFPEITVDLPKAVFARTVTFEFMLEPHALGSLRTARRCKSSLEVGSQAS